MSAPEGRAMDGQAPAAGILQQLRQRKMAQWAIAYAAGAWVLLQVLGLAADSYEWPRIVMRLAFGGVVLGFVATLVLAWYHGERGQQKVGGTELLILSLLLAVGGGLLWRMEGDKASAEPPATAVAAITPASPAAAPISNKSIAVLPFANLSSDKDNAYFAEGIQDEILTRLAKIGDLKVISRTSTLRYASKPDNLPEIARQLGVANIVEGSVQKVGNNVRINVQLIRADTDAHLWAEIYDRKLEDVFSIQSEVAGAIASALQATLTQEEQRQVALRSTDDTAAYDAYLRGLAYETRALYSTEDKMHARDQFAEATRLDPAFVDAWVHLVDVQSFLYFNGVERTPAMLERMRLAAGTVARLRPGSAEAWMARGFYHYRGLRDLPVAREAFGHAVRLRPNNAEMLFALAFVERRLGYLDEALGHLLQANALDPASPNHGALQGEILTGLRRFPEARAALERARKRLPDDVDLVGAQVQTWHAEGNLEAAQAVLRGATQARPGDMLAVSVELEHLFLRRRYDAVIERAQPLIDADRSLGWEYRTLRLHVAIADALRLRGDADAARSAYATAARGLDAARVEASEANIAIVAARIHAGLGDKAAALRAIDESIAEEDGDAKETPVAQASKASILARFGDRDAALELLVHLLEVPYGLTPARLRLDPEWDVLRDDARFRKLSEESNGDGSHRRPGKTPEMRKASLQCEMGPEMGPCPINPNHLRNGAVPQ
jgi:TolB-like protein